MSAVIITSKMKEDAKKCNGKICSGCKMYSISKGQSPYICVEALASLPGVWDDAPEWADCADVTFTDKNRTRKGHTQTYTRTLPKLLIEELSEKYAIEIDTEPLIVKLVQNKLVELLKEYNERQGK